MAKLKEDLEKAFSALKIVGHAIRFLKPNLINVLVFSMLMTAWVFFLVITNTSVCELEHGSTDLSCVDKPITRLSLAHSILLGIPFFYVLSSAGILLYKKLFVKSYLK